MEWLAGKSSVTIACVLLALGAGCAGRPASETPPALSSVALKEKADAEDAYRACLLNAAHYADDRKADIAGVALVVTPMCYPEFARFAAASEAGLTQRDRKQYIRDADRLQMDMADAAIAQERNETIISASR